MTQIFISYALADLDFAENVRDRLEAEGFRVWFDEQRRFSEDWRAGVEAAVRASFALIVIRRVAELLGQFGDPAAVPGLLEFLRDCDYSGWHEVKNALVQIGGDAVVSGILEILQDQNTTKGGREGAVFALEKIEDIAAVPGLLRALQQDENSRVREVSARALGKLRDATAIPQLREALQDENREVRATAAFALLSIGTPEALEILKSTGTPEALQALEYGRVNLHKFTF